jgi:hypothetical protein
VSRAGLEPATLSLKVRCYYQLSYRLEPVPSYNLTSAAAVLSRLGCPLVYFGSSSPHANVAELADALDLGSSARKGMGVRPSPFAPFIQAWPFTGKTYVLCPATSHNPSVTC